MPDVAAAPATSQTEVRRFLTFRSGGELYALPAGQISEVIRLPGVARVPQAPKGLLGLANLRGSVLPVASLRGLLGSEATEAPGSRAIVLDDAAPVVLAVDSVEALVNIDTHRIETRQSALAAKSGEPLNGAFAADGKNGIAKILDIAALIGAAFTQQSRARATRGLADLPRAEKAESTARDDRQMLVTFDIAGQEYAFALDVVQEVLDAPESFAALPDSESLVLGVSPFRDTLLPVLSLRGLLGFPVGARDGREKVVVAKVGGALVGLLADRMRAIFPADIALIEKIPPVLAARAGGEAKISAIYRGDQGRRLVSLLSPERLFREDVMQRLKSMGASAVQPETDSARSGGEDRQFVVFRLGDDEFGLPIEAVEEVARVPDQITRLPRTPKFLEGVVNLRGEVLPVVDQRRRFDMPLLERQGARRLIVVRTERHKAGLIVDSVSEVLRFASDAIEPSPNLTNEAVRLVAGVINLEASGRIVLLLDPAELLTRTERGLLDSFQAKTDRKPL
ncbi:chemotaxis protein CheW [soil metagenome]